MPRFHFLNWPFFEDAHREYARGIREWAAATIPGITEDEPGNNEQLDAQMRELVTTIGAAAGQGVRPRGLWRLLRELRRAQPVHCP